MDEIKNFTPLKNLKKKKINKWFVFGNLFLVILVAVIGIVYYNNTLITTQQKAGFECSDWSNKRLCREERKKYEESGQAEADKLAKKKEEQQKKRMKEELYVPPGGCPAGYISCNVGGKGFCISNDGSEGGCNQGAVNRGLTVKIGGDGPGAGGWLCEYGKNGYSGGSCVGYNSVKEVGQGKPPNCFCGIIQIDGGQWAGTYQSTCGCDKEQEEKIKTTVVGTIIPTPTDIPTETPTEIPTETPTDIPTETQTPTPTLTGTPSPTVTGTPSPTLTQTPTPVQSIPTAGTPKPFVFLIPLGIIVLSLLL